MKHWDAAVVAAFAAHVLAWAVGLWLALGPVYRGVSVTAVAPGEAPGEATRFTATLIQVNGSWVILLLAAPVVLTALTLVSVLLTDAGQARRRVFLWASAILLSGFGVLGSFSIGLFYLPAALALIVSAVLGSRGNAAETARP